MDLKDLFILVTVILACNTDAMSRQQLKNTSKMLKKNCMAKIGVAEDMIANIEKGQFIEDRDVMCYIACIYQMTQIVQGTNLPKDIGHNTNENAMKILRVKNNKLSYEASIKQVDIMYPAEIKDAVKASIENCKDVSKKYKDLCEASYWSAKCMYEDDPKNFIFP